MTFKSAYLKLSLFYTLIIMIVSVGFSLALYKISTDELGRGLNRQTRALREMPIGNNPTPLPWQELENIRLQQQASSAARLRIYLIDFNLLILIGATVTSYFLAKRTLKPIEESMETQKRFTVDASHELRTPLTAMRAEIEVGLRDKNINLQSARKLLQSNLQEIEKLENLSGALLELAKSQTDLVQDFQTLDIEELIIKAYEKVEKLADQKKIQFKNQLRGIEIQGDERSLVQLFVVLLENAIKYSPQKSYIKIVVKKHDKKAIVSITDQGIGIKAVDLPYIFDRFYRADHSRSKIKADGYGLGLSIAKSIANLHSGNIFVKSQYTKGSTFIVALPIK